jgi:predicted RecA/RadA family phage recombinase
VTTQGGIVEYVKPGTNMTFTAGAAITGGNLVYVSAGMTVLKTAILNEPRAIGVALYNAVSGDALTVATKGVWPLVAAGAITFGDCVVPAAAVAGTVSTLIAPADPLVANTAAMAAINAVKGVVGKALESIADTASGRVKLNL